MVVGHPVDESLTMSCCPAEARPTNPSTDCEIQVRRSEKRRRLPAYRTGSIPAIYPIHGLHLHLLRHFLRVERQMLRGGYRPVKLGSYKVTPARRAGLEGASVGNPDDACCEITVFIGLYGIMFKDARVYWLTSRHCCLSVFSESNPLQVLFLRQGFACTATKTTMFHAIAID